MNVYTEEEVDLLPIFERPRKIRKTISTGSILSNTTISWDLILPNQRHFVLEVPFKDIPLYINDRNLKVYIEWRLKLGK